MSRIGAIMSMAAALTRMAAVGGAINLVPVEEVRPLFSPSMWHGGGGRFDPRIPYSRRSSQRQRRKLRRRGVR